MKMYGLWFNFQWKVGEILLKLGIINSVVAKSESMFIRYFKT